jgi:hypothetical protein
MILGIATIITASYMNRQYNHSKQSVNQSEWVTKLKLSCGNTAASSSITLVKSQTVQ